MKIKDELVLYGMPWAAVDEIEYNAIGEFQTSDSNTPVYYIFQRTGNAYNPTWKIYMSCIRSSSYNS